MPSQVQIFCVSCANPPASTNFENTVIEGVDEPAYRAHTNIPDTDPAPIWGVRTGGWDKYDDKLEIGDIFLFYTGDNSESGDKEYRYMATVDDIENRNPDLANEIWEAGDDVAREEWPHIIYLTDVTEVGIKSRQLHDDIGWKAEYLMDFRRVKPEDLARITSDAGSVRAYLSELATLSDELEYEQRKGVHRSSRPDREEQSRDLKPPEKKTYEVSRIVRNSGMVKQLKKEYDYQCQICGEVRRRGSDEPYAEGHHLQPLGDSPPGPDVQSNLLVLCPNHHADFDYGMIRIDPESLEIEHAYESLEQDALITVPGHNPDPEYLEYNNQEAEF